jgi:ADP-ribosylglycohydrolase
MAPERIESKLPHDHAERMTRALLSLEGLSVGDALGQRFFCTDVEWLANVRAIPRPPWRYTDDTMMALSIVETLDRFGFIEPDFLAARFATRYQEDVNRGYGPTAIDILEEIGRGTPWQIASSEAFLGEGSMGNGGAMRAGPIGAYFADDLREVAENARASAMVTHAHPEGQAGAIAVAVAAAQAWRLRSSATVLEPQSILEVALEYTPDGKTRKGIRTASQVAYDKGIDTAVALLGNGTNIVSHDTVPFALWCSARHLTDFAGAFWATVSGLGDIDTNCAIVGGIVALAVGREAIPTDWIESREPLKFRSEH